MNRKVVPHRDVPGAPVGAALVSAAGLVWVNGVLPLDLENPSKALAESVEEQSRHIMRNLDQLLSVQGLSRQQVLAVTVHLRQMNRFGGRFEKVYAGFFEAPHIPTRSLVGVSELPREALVAMDFVVHAE
jgi:enamine deaminase RidA (YjgF/YER057c/UK114 family)